MQVYDFVQLDNVYYAESHDLDISAPSQSPNYGDPKHQTKVVDKNFGVNYELYNCVPN